MSGHGLTEQELLKIVDGWTESDDDMDDDFEEIIESLDLCRHTVIRLEENEQEISNQTELNDNLFDINNLDIELVDELPGEDFNTNANSSISISELKTKYSKLIWKKRTFEIDEKLIAFKGSVELPPEILKLTTPYTYFKYFFDDQLCHNIVEESNLYAFQKNPNNQAMLTENLLEKFIGICTIMSIVYIPNSRHYWSPTVGNPLIQDTMSLNSFEKIKSILHFNNNNNMVPRSDPNHDRIFKIRPVIEHLRKRFQTVPLEILLSVDEQLCSTKAKSCIKQYLPSKPHKWGYKLFILAGTSGFCYNFEIYTGKENDPANRLTSEPDLGACANIVIRMLRTVPNNLHYRVFFDNYFSTIPLVAELSKRGILCLGTVRKNRIPNCKLPSDKDMNKEKRGTSTEFVTDVDGHNITVVSWKDTKCVSLISNFVGQQPIASSQRFEKKQGSVSVDCPNIVKEYNKYMGGVDHLDSLIGRYKIKMRSKKWYLRIFYHIIDVTITNSWLLYKRVESSRNTKETKLLSLPEFRLQLSEALCSIGETRKLPGRPSNDLNLNISEKRKKPNAAPLPVRDVRTDKIDHWPEWMQKRLTCKLPNCNGYTFVKCSKCGVALCFNKDRNCFKSFHF